jgi:hypothetical protein
LQSFPCGVARTKPCDELSDAHLYTKPLQTSFALDANRKSTAHGGLQHNSGFIALDFRRCGSALGLPPIYCAAYESNGNDGNAKQSGQKDSHAST